jgi:hypothetical protein
MHRIKNFKDFIKNRDIVLQKELGIEPYKETDESRLAEYKATMQALANILSSTKLSNIEAKNNAIAISNYIVANYQSIRFHFSTILPEDFPSIHLQIKKQIEDYIGVNGEFSERFRATNINLLTNLFELNGNDRIIFEYKSDAICESCNPEEMQQEAETHCFDERMGEYDRDAFKITFEILQNLVIENPESKSQFSIVPGEDGEAIELHIEKSLVFEISKAVSDRLDEMYVGIDKRI